MPVCIAGMHRSGTSMVTNLLHLCGLYLGAENELTPATPANPEGHWEHKGFVEINEGILKQLGGAWYQPPSLNPGWENNERIFSQKQAAVSLVRTFLDREPWGWKDPRNSLTLPLWKALLPGARVVICVRNPLEVVASLQRRPVFKYSEGSALWKLYKETRAAVSLTRRRSFSTSACMELWRSYNQRILSDTTREQRIITHYESYLRNANTELQRVLRFLDLEVPDQFIERAGNVASSKLRHHKASGSTNNLPIDVSQLYEELNQEAGFVQGA